MAATRAGLAERYLAKDRYRLTEMSAVLGVGLHSYGFSEGGYQGAMSLILAGVMSFPIGAYWRRKLTYMTA